MPRAGAAASRCRGPSWTEAGSPRGVLRTGPLRVPPLPWNLSAHKDRGAVWPGSLLWDSSGPRSWRLSLSTQGPGLLGWGFGFISCRPALMLCVDPGSFHFLLLLVKMLIFRKPSSLHPQVPELNSLCILPPPHPLPANLAQVCLIDASFPQHRGASCTPQWDPM